jgi:hypothetical protein
MLLIREETLQSNQKDCYILKEQKNAMHETSVVNTFVLAFSIIKFSVVTDQHKDDRMIINNQ